MFKLSIHYQNYVGLQTGTITQKPRRVRSSQKEKDTSEDPPPAPKDSKPKGKRIKHVSKRTSAPISSPLKGKAREKAPALDLLSEAAISEKKQLKITLKKSLLEQSSRDASGSGEAADEDVNERAGLIPGVRDTSLIDEKTKSDEDMEALVLRKDKIFKT